MAGPSKRRRSALSNKKSDQAKKAHPKAGSKPRQGRASVLSRKHSEHASEARERAIKALGLMRREKISMSEACRLEHVKPATFLRYLGSAIRQEKPGGPYRPTAGDSFKRKLRIPTAQGYVAVHISGSKNARLISEYANAVSAYLNGKRTKLDKFKGMTVKADGEVIELVTDRRILSMLQEADALHIDQLYAVTTGQQ